MGWLGTAVLVLCLSSNGRPAQAEAQPGPWRHAISLTGEPRYPTDFRQTDYVNAQAPKGGRARIGDLGTFDNFNPVVAGVKGNIAAYLNTIYEPLLKPALDEPTTEYGLLAEAVSYPADTSSVSFRLRPEARWHDGVAVSAEDVVFSFQSWKAISPQFNRYFNKVQRAEIVNPREVRFVFSEGGDAALPLYVGQMSILPKHWWEGRDAKGRKRDIRATTLEPPLGSGPYRIKSFTAGRSLVLERVDSYWGLAVPIRVGTENLDRLEIEYFRDAAVMFEAFKADRLDMRRETSIKSWITGYDFAAAREGHVVKEAFPIARLGIVKAFVFNLRREQFADVRVRRALAMAYSFDEMNRNVFHNMLSRPASFFPRTDFEATGPLSEEERGLLASLTGAPSADTLAHVAQHHLAAPRADLFNALELLKEAGYRLNNGRLLDKAGQQLTLEFVLEDGAMERIAAPYAANLAKLGIASAIRLVDDVQYQNRLRNFDFDIVAHAWVQGHAPGNEQREYWASDSAAKRGTNNIAGLESPLIDGLVEKLVLAPTRTDKIAAGRLLDRVLRTRQIGVMIGAEDKEYMAYWNRFAHPARMPEFGAMAFPSIWWRDETKPN